MSRNPEKRRHMQLYTVQSYIVMPCSGVLICELHALHGLTLTQYGLMTENRWNLLVDVDTVVWRHTDKTHSPVLHRREPVLDWQDRMI